MNPMFPAVPLPVHGYLELLFLLTAASLLVILVMMLWSGRGGQRLRVGLFCPVRLRRIRVVLGVGPNGMPSDVLRCPEFRGHAITCGKMCLHTTVR